MKAISYPCFVIATKFEALRGGPTYEPFSEIQLVDETFNGEQHALIFLDVDDCRAHARGIQPAPEPLQLVSEWFLWKALQKSKLSRLAILPKRSKTPSQFLSIDDLDEAPKQQATMDKMLDDKLGGVGFG